MKKIRPIVLIALILACALACASAAFAMDSDLSDDLTPEEFEALYPSVKVSIISPAVGETAADSLFISVSIAHGMFSSYMPTAARVSVDRVERISLGDDEIEEILTPVREPVIKDSGKAWYYTERLENLEPGIYRVTVEAKNAYANEDRDWAVTKTATVTLTEKKTTGEKVVIEPEKVEPKETKETAEPTGLKKFVQILKNLFTK